MGGEYGNKRAIAPEREYEVIELYLENGNCRSVAESFGVSDETIRRVLKRNGVPRRKRKPESKKSESQINRRKGVDRARVGELYQSGMSITAIANELDCSATSVYYHLEKLGLYKIGERKARNESLTPQLVELHNQGLSDYEIAEKLEVGRYLVNSRLRKMGIVRGKGFAARKGSMAYVAKMREIAIERFDANPDVELIEYGNPSKVRCTRCGTEYEWTKWTHKCKEPCPECRERDKAEQRAASRAARDRKQYEREQQRIAAREWRLSVPHICKECGESFYSEHDNAVYCSDVCRKRSDNRKAAERRKRRGVGSGSYGRRLKVKKSKSTYDRTITRAAVYKKYHGRCCNCGCKTHLNGKWSWERMELDHVIALNNNGTHTWDNVQLLCARCNNEKADTGQMRLAIA